MGVLVGAIVSFLVAMFILKLDKSEDLDDTFSASVEQAQAAKAQSKGQASSVSTQQVVETSSTVDEHISKVIFACDAGMGSSAMGVSLMRKKVQDAGLDMPVTNSSISNLKDEDGLLVITQEELTERAKQKAPKAVHVSVDNFLSSPKYAEIIEQLKN